MKYTKFEDLPVWKGAMMITRMVYKVSAVSRWNKDFGLRDQIRRAVVSVSANIVEGFEKNNNNEFIRYLKIAKGSAGEVKNHLYIAHAINYINDKNFNIITKRLDELSCQIGGLIVYLQEHRAKKQSAIRNS